MRFIGDLTQSRGTECVWFGRNGSPVAAVLYVNALDRSVREGPNDPGQTRMVEGTAVEPAETAEPASLSGTGG
jgi:hypothetical protein